MSIVVHRQHGEAELRSTVTCVESIRTVGGVEHWQEPVWTYVEDWFPCLGTVWPEGLVPVLELDYVI